MRPQSVTMSAAGSSAWIPVNNRAEQSFGIGFGCVVAGGSTLTYKVEHTFDNVFDSSVTPTAFDHATVVGKTANSDGNYAYPIRAVRLTVTSFTSGSVTATFLQIGP